MKDLGKRHDSFEEIMESKLEEQGSKINVIRSDLTQLQKGTKRKRETFCMDDLKAELQYHYRTCETTFFPVDWSEDCLKQLNDMYVQLELTEVGKFESSRRPLDGKQTYTIYDSFHPHHKCNQPRRILWIGEAGVGKTTSCKKFAIDFSTDFNTFTKRFPGINLLIFLRCRNLEGHLFRNISELLLPEAEQNEERLKDWMEENSSSVIFLIDGLDELTVPNKELEALLTGKVFRDARVIVSCRREGLKGRQRYFDSIFNINGLKSSDLPYFVRNYFAAVCPSREKSSKYADSLLLKLEHDQSLSGLSKIPLCLLILCVVWEEQEGTLPKSLAELYKTFVDCIIERFLSKSPTGSSSRICSHLILILSHVAYSTLKKNFSYFEKRELEEIIGNISDVTEAEGIQLINRCGLISIDKSGSKLSRSSYQFFHKSFQEYFSSLYVTSKIQNASEKEKPGVLDELSWVLKLSSSWNGNIDWEHRLLVLFLAGSFTGDDCQFFLKNTMETLSILRQNGWRIGLLYDVVAELGSKCLIHSAELIGSAFPRTVNGHRFGERLHDVAEGPLEHWATTREDSILNFDEEFNQTKLDELKKLLMNKKCKISQLKSTVTSDMKSAGMDTVARLWWKSNSLEMLNISCHKADIIR